MTTTTEFRLSIEIGNEATLDDESIAALLRKAAERIEYRGDREGTILDFNGNRVGHFGYVDTEA